MGKREDLTGKVFWGVEALYQSGHRNKRVVWVCKCHCGNLFTTYAKTLKDGKTKSCGCLRKKVSAERATTHGMKYTREYKVWSGMKARCRTKSASGY